MRCPQAVGDMFIWMPNAVGFLLGCLLLVLCLVYPRQPRYTQDKKLDDV